MIRDLRFWAALLIAPLVWSGWYALQQPVVDLGWPFHSPTAFLLPALLYPVLEEIIFRGFIQEQAQRWTAGKNLGPITVANGLTSLLFAAVHVALYGTLWISIVFFPSLLFGYFKDRYQRLTAPIVLHIFYNSGYFLLFHPGA